MERLEVLFGSRGDGSKRAVLYSDLEQVNKKLISEAAKSATFATQIRDVIVDPNQVINPLPTLDYLSAIQKSLLIDYTVAQVASEAAIAARDAADAAKIVAQSGASTATTKAGEAATSASDAGVSRAQAATFAQQSATSESAAAGSASASATSESGAATSATASSTSAAAADEKRLLAATSAGQASTSQQAAATSESGAGLAFNAAVAASEVAAKLLTAGGNVLESPFFEDGTFTNWGVTTGRTSRVNDVYDFGQSLDFDLSSTVAANVGVQWSSDLAATWIGDDHHAGYSITVEFDWVSGASLDGAGIYATWLRLSDGSGTQITAPLKDHIEEPVADIVAGRRYTASIYVERPADLAYDEVQEFNLALIADNTTLFDGPVSKQIVFHKITVVPISVLEANVTETKTAIAGINTGLGATAHWKVVAGAATSYLEAYAWDDLNGNATSGLTFSSDLYTFEGGMLLFKDAILQSDNYVEDTSGWKIDDAGYAQFNELLVTGNMVADGFITARMFEQGSIRAPLGAIDSEFIASSTSNFQFKHPGIAIVYAMGGAGSGGAATSYLRNVCASGGGAGGFSSLLILDVDLNETYAATIGAGGASVTASGSVGVTQGRDGGNTSFVGGLIDVDAFGGNNGTAAASSSQNGPVSTAGAAGGGAQGGDFNYTGGSSGSCSGKTQITEGGCMDFGATTADSSSDNGFEAGYIIGGGRDFTVRIPTPMHWALMAMSGGVPEFMGFANSNFSTEGTYAKGGRGVVDVGTGEQNNGPANSVRGGPGIVIVVYFGERGIV
jgi:hypothetical protein